MRKKRLFSVLAMGAFGITLCVGAGLYAAADVPDVIKMENKAYKKHSDPIVEFHHKKHAEEYAKKYPDLYKSGCGECHHDDKNQPLKDLKPGDAVKSCIECHKKLGEMPSKEKRAMRKKKLSKKEQKSRKMEYHAEAVHDNCKVCHRIHIRANKLKPKNPGYPPIQCKKCHTK